MEMHMKYKKITPKHVKSQIFRNWIQKWIISSTQLKHCCDILWQNFDVIYLLYLAEQKSFTKDKMFNVLHENHFIILELKFWKLILYAKTAPSLLYSFAWLISTLTNTMYDPWIFSLENNLSKKHSRQNYLVYTCT